MSHWACPQTQVLNEWDGRRLSQASSKETRNLGGQKTLKSITWFLDSFLSLSCFVTFFRPGHSDFILLNGLVLLTLKGELSHLTMASSLNVGARRNLRDHNPTWSLVDDVRLRELGSLIKAMQLEADQRLQQGFPYSQAFSTLLHLRVLHRCEGVCSCKRGFLYFQMPVSRLIRNSADMSALFQSSFRADPCHKSLCFDLFHN